MDSCGSEQGPEVGFCNAVMNVRVRRRREVPQE
jgi:hypothetical protein